MMKGFPISLTACLLSAFCCSGQDLHFSQFNETPMMLNPALTAVVNDMRAGIQYKDQWRSISSPFMTYSGSFEIKITKKNWTPVKNRTNIFKLSAKNLAAGLHINRDVAGDGKMGTFQANLSLASHVRLSEKQQLSIGLLGAYAQRSISMGSLTWDNQFDGMNYNPSLGSGESGGGAFSYFDYGAGVFWNFGRGEMYMRSNDSRKFNLGASIWHFTRPRYNFLGGGDRLYMKYMVHGGGLFGLKNTRIDLVPSFLFAMQGPSKEIVFGTLLKYNIREDSKYTGYISAAAWSFGVHYRLRDAIIASTLIEMGQWAMGISYDVNVSSLSRTSVYRGGFEITLRFTSQNAYLFELSPSFN